MHRGHVLCRAIDPGRGGQALTLEDIQTARTSHRRRALRAQPTTTTAGTPCTAT